MVFSNVMHSNKNRGTHIQVSAVKVRENKAIPKIVSYINRGEISTLAKVIT